MEGFFYAAAPLDEIELKELLLHRYGTLNFIDSMEIGEFVDFCKCAMEKDHEERLYMEWCAKLPMLRKEYWIFSRYRDDMMGKGIDLRPADVIMEEIERKHRERG